ncbi:MAG: hypothetical protein R3A47_09700 [Polyangiales bacterium]
MFGNIDPSTGVVVVTPSGVDGQSTCSMLNDISSVSVFEKTVTTVEALCAPTAP